MTTPPAVADPQLAAALARLPEVPDDAVPPEVKAVFESIPDTLRVPFVGGPFRMLASDPPLLLSLWAALERPLATRYLEREADRLRTHALFIAPQPDLGAATRAHLLRQGIDERTISEIRRLNETVHYALPKYLIAAAAAAFALRGESVGGEAGRDRGEDLQPLPRGIAPGTERPEPVRPGDAAPEVQRLLESARTLHQHPFTSGYFRSIARWPAYLGRAVDDLRLIVGSPRYQVAAATLASLAEVAARNLPLPVKVEAKGALSAEEAGRVLGFFHQRLLPDLLLDLAYLRAILENERRARTNVFSVTCA